MSLSLTGFDDGLFISEIFYKQYPFRKYLRNILLFYWCQAILYKTNIDRRSLVGKKRLNICYLCHGINVIIYNFYHPSYYNTVNISIISVNLEDAIYTNVNYNKEARPEDEWMANDTK